MKTESSYDVIIIGGSYAGLSAAMALGRSLRNVLIIDSGNPCNKQTPYSHNFITQDGTPPAEIARIAKEQVLKYDTVTFYNGLATAANKTEHGLEVAASTEEVFKAKKLIIATGVRDIMPDIRGFAECWGISVIHCPYCHGYEVRNERTGLLANGDVAYETAKLLTNWTMDLTVFTNGKSTLTPEQTNHLKQHNIEVIDKHIDLIKHKDGYLEHIRFADGQVFHLKATYARIGFEQHSGIPMQLGCQLTEMGHLQTDMFQKTTVPGVFACGDSTTMMRSVASVVASGNMAGVMANKELIDESF
ncbi:MAG: NAD(P)/FAD-dependent oxidoreductase [Sphingobacteriales bacterium]|nr:MAG: NAD(P)/FAD-dependent oxidoreductase [Sphingobacteriales bacterium]